MPPIEMLPGPPELPDVPDPDPPSDGPVGVTVSGAGEAVTLLVQNSWAIVAPAADASRTSTRRAAPPKTSLARRGRGGDAASGVSDCGAVLSAACGSAGRANGDVYTYLGPLWGQPKGPSSVFSSSLMSPSVLASTSISSSTA